MSNQIIRHASDPALNLLARRLLDLVWMTPLDVDEIGAAAKMGQDPEARRRWVNPMPDFKSWAVRMYIGGAQRTVGVIKPANHDISTALRFADMVAMYFWPHKVRGAHEPDDRELNFSVDRAKTDLELELNALQLIKDIEAHLISIGAILSSEEMEHLRKVSRDMRKRRQILSGAMMDSVDAVLAVVRRLEESQRRIEDKLGRLHGAPSPGGTTAHPWFSPPQTTTITGEPPPASPLPSTPPFTC